MINQALNINKPQEIKKAEELSDGEYAEINKDIDKILNDNKYNILDQEVDNNEEENEDDKIDYNLDFFSDSSISLDNLSDSSEKTYKSANCVTKNNMIKNNSNFNSFFNKEVSDTKKLNVDKKKITKIKLKRPLTQQKIGKINTKIAPNPKITLTLKNALKSNNGKEFTINVTDQNINKCFTKYSGGPENIPFLNGKFEEKNNDINLDKFVDFYKLEEKNTGNSYLHLATIDNYPMLVQYFLEKGANVNVQNYDGDTPLHIALRNKNNEIIKLIMEKNPAMNIPNNKGDIAFELFTPQMKIDYHIDRLNIINPVKKDGFI